MIALLNALKIIIIKKKQEVLLIHTAKVPSVPPFMYKPVPAVQYRRNQRQSKPMLGWYLWPPDHHPKQNKDLESERNRPSCMMYKSWCSYWSASFDTPTVETHGRVSRAITNSTPLLNTYMQEIAAPSWVQWKLRTNYCASEQPLHTCKLRRPFLLFTNFLPPICNL